MTFYIFRGRNPFDKAIAITTDKLLVMGWWRVLNLKSTRSTLRTLLIIHAAPRVGEVWLWILSTDTRCKLWGLHDIVEWLYSFEVAPRLPNDWAWQNFKLYRQVRHFADIIDVLQIPRLGHYYPVDSFLLSVKVATESLIKRVIQIYSWIKLRLCSCWSNYAAFPVSGELSPANPSRMIWDLVTLNFLAVSSKVSSSSRVILKETVTYSIFSGGFDGAIKNFLNFLTII